MKSVSLDGGNDGEYSGIDCMELFRQPEIRQPERMTYKQANFGKMVLEGRKFGSFDEGDNEKYNSDGLVESSKIFTTKTMFRRNSTIE